MKSSGLILFVCAGLLLSGGAILGGSTAWNLFRMSYYFWTTDLGVELGSSVLFLSGGLLCLPACWLSTLVPYYNKSMTLLATLMVLVTATLVLLSTGMSSIMALSKATRDPAALNLSMLRAMSMEAVDPAVKSAFTAMQIELKCCGVQSHTDWYQHRRNIPPACCGRLWHAKQGERCSYPRYITGCLQPAITELRHYVNSLTVVACGIIVVMAVTLFTTSYTLVSGVVERANKSLQPMRIACLANPPAFLHPTPAITSNPTVTSPALTYTNPHNQSIYPSLVPPTNPALCPS